MDSFILDTNIIIDALSARILDYLNFNLFYVSQVVFKEEIIKQIPSLFNYNLNLINETYEELMIANEYKSLNNRISFYDALNLAIAKERKMILVKGDQQLVKCANQKEVECIGTLKLIEILIENNKISIEESIIALQKLKLDIKRRIPHNLIDSLIEKLQTMNETIRL